MSCSFWVIQGIGLRANDIEPHIDKEKAARCILDVYPHISELYDMTISNDYSSFNVQDYIECRLFDNIGDLLTFCDPTDSLTFCGDGEGNVYFYYPPSMPWERFENEPTSEEEVIQRIIFAVKGLTDLQANEIREMIDRELYVVGAG